MGSGIPIRAVEAIFGATDGLYHDLKDTSRINVYYNSHYEWFTYFDQEPGNFSMLPIEHRILVSQYKQMYDLIKFSRIDLNKANAVFIWNLYKAKLDGQGTS